MDEEKFATLSELLAVAAGKLLDDGPTQEVETVETHVEHASDGSAPHAQTHVGLANFFRHPDTHPLLLDLALLRKYGPDFLLWEQETIELRVGQDFKSSQISEVNMSKLQACRTLHLVDTFWTQWEVFCWVTIALNGFLPDFESLHVPTVAQCAVAVDIANRIRDDVPWSSEVQAFVEQIFHFEGVFCPAPPLDFVHLHTEDSIVDCSDVHERWKTVSKTRVSPKEDSIVGEQLRRLLAIQTHVEESRASLRTQLPLVQHV